MPDSTPIRSLPYPVPGDPIRDYPAVARQFAELLDLDLELPAGQAVGDVLTWNGSRWVPMAGVATPGVPSATVPPAFSGAVNAGQTVTRTPGTWVGNPAPSVEWAWQLNGADVQAGGDTYAIPGDAAGKTLALIEQASSPFGSSSSRVESTINVGIRGTWRASRPWADVSSADYVSLPFFRGGPAGTGVLEIDDWAAGQTDDPRTPAPGTYRVQGHVEFPDNWNQGSSGDANSEVSCFAGAEWKGHQSGPAGFAPNLDQTFTNVAANALIGIAWRGGATGKAPRPNNFWLQITHLG
jgi:hypothetical protein